MARKKAEEVIVETFEAPVADDVTVIPNQDEETHAPEYSKYTLQQELINVGMQLCQDAKNHCSPPLDGEIKRIYAAIEIYNSIKQH